MYQNVDEIIETMSRVYEILNADQDCKELYGNIGDLSMQIKYTDFNEWVTQIVEKGECNLVKGQVGEAHVQEFISSETFNEIFTGVIQAPEAAMAGKISFEGDFSKMLLLQPLLDKTREAYIKVTKER